MKNKFWWISVGIILVVILLILAFSGVFTGSPNDDVSRAQINEETVSGANSQSIIIDGGEEKIMIDPLTSSFNFIGYGPGKKHPGTFETLNGDLLLKDGKIVGFTGMIQADSVNTGIGGLDNHLKGADFFEVDTYPEITFSSTSLEDSVLTGDLTFRGIKKSVSFPVTITDDTISSEFAINVRDYGVGYAAMDDEVEITFMFSK